MPEKRRVSRSTPRPAPRKPTRRVLWFPIIGGLALVALVLAGGGFAFAATQEQHDAFCASCHTQPETTFYQRSVTAATTTGQPVDLASFHATKNTLCINCHSGSGLTGRISAETVGARNAVLWYTGQAVQPAPLVYPIGDGNCLKCHQDVTIDRSRDNHFHAFLANWQAVDPKAAHCVSCHLGHSTDGTTDTGFQVIATTQAVCDSCHAVLRGGEGGD
jgi:hypothetical protein